MQRKHASLSFLVMGLLVISACGPGATTPGTGESSQGEVARGQPKTMRIVLSAEPGGWDAQITGDTVSTQVGGRGNMEPIAQDGLRRQAAGGTYLNLLAATVPTTAAGTWRLNPDATMDMTWTIVPNAKWHDGAPVTSRDFEFAVKVHNDPEASGIPIGSGAQRLLSSVSPVNDYTFVARWSGTYVTADTGVGLIPLPKHLLGDLYERSRLEFRQSRFFTSDYVGTGPFKLVHWEPGSYIEFERFNDYYRGPAKLDRVILQIVTDQQTAVANILAGAVDVVVSPVVDFDVGLEIKNRWDREGSGNQVVITTEDRAESWEIMVDPQYARPLNAMTRQPVRQALFQAVDRYSLVDTMVGGQSTPVYGYVHESYEPYRFVEDLMYPNSTRFQYPYDVQKALQLLADAGWTKGPDGILVHAASGPSQGSPYALPAAPAERFEYQMMTRRGDALFRQAAIIQDYWKAIGVDLSIYVLTPAEQSDNQFIATRTGMQYHMSSTSPFYGRRPHSESIPRPETRWTGNNRGRYSNPTLDTLIERIEVTIDEAEQRSLHRQLFELEMTDLHTYWWYWQTVPTLMLKGVTGPRLVSSTSTNNIWEWDKT